MAPAPVAMDKTMKILMIKYSTYFIFAMLIIGLLFACEPGGTITFQNLRNQDITIYYTSVLANGTLDQAVKQAVVPANSAKKFGAIFLGEGFVLRIEAKDSSNKIVFSQDYKMADLDKIDWKITIPP